MLTLRPNPTHWTFSLWNLVAIRCRSERSELWKGKKALHTWSGGSEGLQRRRHFGGARSGKRQPTLRPTVLDRLRETTKTEKNVKEKLEWMQKNQHRSARTIINKFNLPLLSMSMEKSWHGTLSLRAPRLNGGWLLIKKKNVKCYLNLLWLKPRAIFAWETARSKTMDLLGGKVRWRLASTGFVAVRREWFEFNRYRHRIDDVETI